MMRRANCPLGSPAADGTDDRVTGMLALRAGRPRHQRLAGGLVAALAAGYIVAVALSRSATPGTA
jgi:hypothetical protein